MKRNLLSGSFFIILGGIIFISTLSTCIALNYGPNDGIEGPVTKVPCSVTGSQPPEQSNIVTENETENYLTIRLRLEKLDMPNRELTCLIDLRASKEFQDNLWDIRENTNVADISNGLRLKSEYENYMLPLEINECSSGVNKTVQIPLKSLFLTKTESCPQPSTATEIILPMTGRPQLYPEDWYLFNATFKLLWNGPIFPYGIEPAPDSCVIPPEIKIYSDVNLCNKNIVVQQYPNSCGGAIKLLIRTGTFARLYTWIIALVPIYLLLVFIHLLYVNSDRHRISISNLIAGLVAAIIAVLPLRIVLVPSEIPGLTCVDLILATGMASIFALVLITYGFEIIGWRKRKVKKER